MLIFPRIFAAAMAVVLVHVAAGATGASPSKGGVPIAAGDRLEYRVVESGEPSRVLLVSASGEIELPHYGKVEVAGRTPEAAAKEIKALLEKSLFFVATVLLARTEAPAPEVARTAVSPPVEPPVARPEEKAPAAEVRREGAAPAQVTVMGQVRLQGLQDMPSGMRYMLSHAIIKAGGLTTWANGRKVQVVRKAEDGKTSRFSADVLSVLKEGQLDKDVELEPGDTIIVPERLFSL
jgi:protein involved in polysaccharide export with SLBB domain